MGGERSSRKRHYDFDHEDCSPRAIKRHSNMLIVYRLLCKNARAGSILGKGGEVIAKLRTETQARIKVEEKLQGCEDRVVVVSSPEDTITDELCPAQLAIMRLHDILESEEEEDQRAGGEVVFRMLVPSVQVGPLVGKQGSIIKGLRDETGASIRIHKEVPMCAQIGDEMLQITGESRAMRQAIERVLAILRDAAHKPTASPQPPVRMLPPHLFTPPPSAPPRGPPGTPAGAETMDTEFRMMVHNARVGVVIGKGGDHIKALRRETGAIVKVHEEEEGCEERVVSAQSCDDCHNPYSAAQEALLRVAAAVLQYSADHRGIKLVASQQQIGNLVGKGGGRINSIRRDTDTRIKIGGQDHERPKNISRDDEVIVVEGPPMALLDAVKQITMALREGQARLQNKRLEFPPTMGPGLGRGPGPLFGARGMPMPVMPPGIGMGMPGPSFGAHLSPSSKPPRDVASSSQPSMRITISRDQVGAVLGPRGSNIQQVRSVSGAKVKLHSSEGPDGSRELEISGTLPQMQKAHSMVHHYMEASAGHERGDRR